MIVDRDSWHYRITEVVIEKLFKCHISNSLCAYFWQVVISLASVILASMITTAVLFDLYIIIDPRFTIEQMGSHSTVHFVYVVAGLFVIIVSCIALGFALFAALFFGIVTLISMGFNKLRNRPKSKHKHKPNVAVEYVRAKKEKICPIIEFK